MKAFVVLCLCGLSSVLLAAQSKPRAFTDPDGIYRFNYPPVLVQCNLEGTRQGQNGFWVPDGCLCDDEDSVTTVACFAYPKGQFKDKPTFVGATFFVAEAQPAITPDACLEGSRYWLVRSVESTKINAINFKHFRISDAWMSHYQSGDMYRAFHNKKCYELGIQEIDGSFGAYDPGTINEFTKRDAEEVRARLEQALDSFVFLK